MRRPEYFVTGLPRFPGDVSHRFGILSRYAEVHAEHARFGVDLHHHNISSSLDIHKPRLRFPMTSKPDVKQEIG